MAHLTPQACLGVFRLQSIWPPASPATPALGDVKLDASLFLQVADDSEEVAGLRIAARSEHADEALRLRAGRLAKLLEADGHLDVVAQDRIAGVDIASEHGFDSFAQQSFAEGGIEILFCCRNGHIPLPNGISCNGAKPPPPPPSVIR
jgi:hypothetical protein